MTGRDARRRAILAKRYPTRDGSPGRDLRGWSALQADAGPLRDRDAPSPAERLRLEKAGPADLRGLLGRRSLPWAESRPLETDRPSWGKSDGLARSPRISTRPHTPPARRPSPKGHPPPP